MNKQVIEEDKLMPFGVYYHEKKGFAILEPSPEQNRDWLIDKNIRKRHPFLRIKMSMVQEGTGRYYQEKSLKGYEYWGEL